MHDPILILGMHRSGTSALAGSLECAGLHLGKVNRKAAFNKRGNREHEAIRQIHDDLLGLKGHSWKHPPDKPLTWSAEHLERLKLLTTPLAEHPPWGVKDPRSVFCLEGWATLFKPRFVASFRHPMAVARSLAHRAKAWGEDMPIEQGLALWNAYNSAILNVTRDTECRIVCFDLPEAEYKSCLIEVASCLGLNAERVSDFFESDFRHHSATQQEAIPSECASNWSELQARAILPAHTTINQ